MIRAVDSGEFFGLGDCLSLMKYHLFDKSCLLIFRVDEKNLGYGSPDPGYHVYEPGIWGQGWATRATFLWSLPMPLDPLID